MIRVHIVQEIIMHPKIIVFIFSTLAMINIAYGKDLKMPATWAKTFTNDPATNYALQKYGKPLSPDPEVIFYQNTMIFTLLDLCSGIKLNMKTLNRQYQKDMALVVSEKQKADARFLVSSSFRGFDYKELAQVCAGSSYMYGPKGTLLKDAIVGSGLGKPKFPYDANKPYIGLPELR
jgi:hypothetical protein